MSQQKMLSLCIITKNDEASISSLLKNMEGIADEILVADLGSVDHTPDIARELGAVVYEPEWEDSFSKVSNFCMEHASGKWVLFLQADEIIPSEQLKELKLLLQNPAAEGYLFDIAERQEKQVAVFPSQSLRLLRNRKNYRFCYRSFAYIPEEELYSILNSGIAITHSAESSGWQNEERGRLIDIDLADHSQDAYVWYLEGIKLFNQQQYKQSAASFELALHGLRGGYIYAPFLYKHLGICLLALSRYQAAEEVLSEGTLLFPFFTDLLVLRAQLYLELGRDMEAIKDLEVCLMLQNTPSICVPKPEIERSIIVNMLEEIRSDAGRNNCYSIKPDYL